MKLGFFTMPIHPLDKDWRQSLREDREAFILADELGFVEAYAGEHITDQAEIDPAADELDGQGLDLIQIMMLCLAPLTKSGLALSFPHEQLERHPIVPGPSLFLAATPKLHEVI